MKWITQLFVPHMRKVHRPEEHVILLLDNCPAHKVEVIGFNGKYLHLVFLPPNLTSWHQPADMGIIQSLKTGYKGMYLTKLLQVCNDPEIYRQAETARACAKRGCKVPS